MIEALLFAAACGVAGGAAGYVMGKRKGEPALKLAEQWMVYWEKKYWSECAERLVEQKFTRPKGIKDMADSQTRLADALAAKNERLERIAAQETLGANATVKRMAAIARGEA
jgi:hypothetical protein